MPAAKHAVTSLVIEIVANAVMFAVAHQVFGDPLILYVIGLVMGMTFAIPLMDEAPARSRARWSSAELSMPAGRAR